MQDFLFKKYKHMKNTDLEREYLVDDTLAKQLEWEEKERFYEEERNKRLPAIIRVEFPKFIKNENKTVKKI